VIFTLDAQTGWTPADEELYQLIRQRPLILVINKRDLMTDMEALALPDIDVPRVYTAAALNQGIDQLETMILKTVQGDRVYASQVDVTLNQRQAAALTRARAALQQVQATIADQLPLDFWTIDLRTAVHALGEVTGEEITESMLDEIFSRFCIGK